MVSKIKGWNSVSAKSVRLKSGVKLKGETYRHGKKELNRTVNSIENRLRTRVGRL